MRCLTILNVRLLVFSLVLPLAGCAGDSNGNDATSPDISTSVDTVSVDTRIPDPDVPNVDTATPEDTPTDTPETIPHKGNFKDPCDDNSDCISGFCVAYMGEKVCTMGCIEDCPQGWQCTQIQAGTEPAYICMSNFAHLCLPCTKSAYCVFGGVTDVACVSYGPEGAFGCY